MKANNPPVSVRNDRQHLSSMGLAASPSESFSPPIPIHGFLGRGRMVCTRMERNNL